MFFQRPLIKYLILSNLLSFAYLYIPAAIADESQNTDEQESQELIEASDKAPPDRSTVTSIEALQVGEQTAGSLSRGAEYCVRNEQYDKAIKLSKMALNKNGDDNEIHQIYAEALEGKMSEQVDRDPSLFNQCIKEWLIVLRQEVGDEKLSYHGLSIPGLGKFYEDEDRVIEARKHLMKLAGSTPKVWETDAKYLKKVLVPTTTTVYGKVMASQKPSSPSQ